MGGFLGVDDLGGQGDLEMEVAMALMETVVEDEEEQCERLVEVFKYK